ncbi:MAG: chemotaxis protein CheA [Kofleriaceae bacterium]|nr:chemotaxis protein CheA [Kofleriaceae bacterium]
MSDDGLDLEMIPEFLQESREHLDRMEQDLLVLERDPTASAPIHSIFRAIHTIKGTAGFLGLARLQRLAHNGEHLLSRLRDGRVTLTAVTTSLLLELCDLTRAALTHIEEHHAESTADHDGLIHRLAAAAEPAPAPAPAPVAGPDAAVAAPRTVAVAASAPSEPAPPPAPGPAAVTAPAGDAAPPSPPAPVAKTATPPDRGPGHAGGHAADASVRVDTTLLDDLVDLAGELVLARSRLGQFARSWADPVHVATWQRLCAISTRLQEQVMKTRMQPIGTGWSKLPRTVRDLAGACGKQVRIELEGQDTELDRGLIEAIRDPLTHVLRNAVDHGIEPPATRVAAGKAAEGVITLRALHDSGNVVIEIRDDGGGVRADRVRAKAIERGLIDEVGAAAMTTAELQQLVFLPGFSTAEAVTAVSGRGVGMDVVRSNIEKIGGVVALTSREGAGTDIRITIPLTLAILPALVVEAGAQRYAIPQAALRELVKIGGDRPLERVHDALVFRLRERLIPVVELAPALGGPAASAPGLLLIVESDGVLFGLAVDGYHNTEEIVVKPLDRHARTLGSYGGATILGDGKVALILDVRALARGNRIAARTGSVAPAAAAVAGLVPEAEAGAGPESLILIRQGDGGRYAVPLASIERIADVAAEQIDRSGGGEVVLLGGEVVPLVRLGDLLHVGSVAGDGPIKLLVCAGAHRVGVVVDAVEDVVQECASVAGGPDGRTPAILCGDRVIDVLDPRVLLAARAGQEAWS